ncbi:MAG: hypothetical protein HYZ91_01860 [Candidatus Omnitrophica bacterium]|nr:hypothetical protein [Candidatus Omnitrophota bacterium]
MQRPPFLAIACALTVGWLSPSAVAAMPRPSAAQRRVDALFHAMAREAADPSDRAAMERLVTVFAERGSVSSPRDGAWVVLTFHREGALEAVQVNAARLLAAPPLIQRAVILHEVEHLKWATQTRRALSAPPAPFDTLHHVVRVLVDDEARAYRRDIQYVVECLNTHGGLTAYLASLPPTERLQVQQYYQRTVEPFLTAAGSIDERSLRQDLIFLQAFPRHYPRYYEAALMWEAVQGHIEVRRDQRGVWRPARLLSPTAFLAWLLP